MPPPRKRTITKEATQAAVATTVTQQLRKVTRTLAIETGTDALTVAEAIAARVDPPMQWQQVNLDDFTAERTAGPRDTNARWRFNIAGPMLVVAENDLPIIEALIKALRAEKAAVQL